jgi:glycosyltransferase involved in cell wall biosynthesis
MKILWITPRWPEPAEDGARIATAQLLRSLQNNQDLEITLLGILPEGEQAPAVRDFAIHQQQVIRRPRAQARAQPWATAFKFAREPRLPITFRSFIALDTKREAKRIVRETVWDWIVFDGMHAAIPFLERNGGDWSALAGRRLIYRAHNVEFELWQRTSRASGALKRAFFGFQAERVREFERELVRRCEWTLPVSEEDERVFIALGARAARVIRIGQEFPPELPRKSPQEFTGRAEKNSGVVLGFLGRLDWLPNEQGLAWFLSEVWPEARASNPSLRLKIAGSGEGRWLERHRRAPGLELLGRVPGVDSFYSSIDAAVVPLFVGSGTRVKVIEASRYGVPCISTSLGVEGCPLEPGVAFVRAESAAEWVRVLEELTSEPAILPAIGRAAFSTMRALYDARAIGDQFAQLLRSGTG